MVINENITIERKCRAIRNIYSEITTIHFKDWSCLDDDGVPVEYDNDLIEVEINRLEAEYDANQYQRDRASAFPSIGDQLDMQYHDQLDGTTTWKDAIAKVKADNPKE